MRYSIILWNSPSSHSAETGVTAEVKYGLDLQTWVLFYKEYYLGKNLVKAK